MGNDFIPNIGTKTAVECAEVSIAHNPVTWIKDSSNRAIEKEVRKVPVLQESMTSYLQEG